MFLALGAITGRQVSTVSLARGLRADGLGTAIGGVFNTFPYTSFSQNVGLVTVTGVRSRYLAVLGGVLLIALALFPQVTHVGDMFPNGARLDDAIETAAAMGMRFHAARGSMSVGTSQMPFCQMPFYNLAAQATSHVAKELGVYTQGVVFTTLVPSPWRTDVPLVRDYQKTFSAFKGSTDYSYLGLEVFANAQVLATALRRAGRSASRETLTAALESMGELDMAPRMSVRYGPGDRAGSSYVGIAIIGSQGRFTE
jgi:hypothetical protein